MNDRMVYSSFEGSHLYLRPCDDIALTPEQLLNIHNSIKMLSKRDFSLNSGLGC